MNETFGTFILDFQTVAFEPDAKIANEMVSQLQKACGLENQYALDPPVQRAGWSFAKLFLSGQFVEKMIQAHGYEIERSKGRKIEDRLVAWLAGELKNRGCGAQIKLAPEMKEI
ncbi:hypothetical protein [Candidatus Nitrososphaera sp. FF02]|uniref:hypothetical protein n=1 Tax=Candidatus Nitrososphaera sp. FF02 TaxID=3398226 RepID=UPI0039ED86A0